ncbi:hypothetical protein OW763_12140 [Clostridium aestuarii]|uniref:DUF2179 domain-containing protein n=1 Tax=Clostridium aestuarii TaxID=338193 RepID=A0ABT4D1G6_9CLOT|nr:hypothetical protein [Clostridium aestuarii]MCY6485089.1 hypothetical protein [Clostridium aestuarii]
MIKLYVTLFLLKLLDGSLKTFKQKALIHNQDLIASVLNSLSFITYMMIINKIIHQNDMTSIIITSSAVFFSTYIPSKIFNRVQRDKVFLFEILPNENILGKEIADLLRENNIAITTYKGYNKQKELVLCCKAFAETKSESKFITGLIENKDTIYNIIEVKNLVAS